MDIAFTDYFENQVLRKRPYIKKEWCIEAITNPLRSEKQADGRTRYWTYVKELAKYLRVVVLEDGSAIHNAFPDRNFKELL